MYVYMYVDHMTYYMNFVIREVHTLVLYVSHMIVTCSLTRELRIVTLYTKSSCGPSDTMLPSSLMIFMNVKANVFSDLSLAASKVKDTNADVQLNTSPKAWH